MKEFQSWQGSDSDGVISIPGFQVFGCYGQRGAGKSIIWYNQLTSHSRSDPDKFGDPTVLWSSTICWNSLMRKTLVSFGFTATIETKANKRRPT